MTTTLREQVAAAYLAGATTREVAAQYGLDAGTVRRWLHADKVPLRKRGQRPYAPDVLEQIITLRRRNKLTWEQIATATGTTPVGARHAYLAAVGDHGKVDRYKHLTGKQADRLREMYAQLPIGWGGQPASRSSEEGRRLAAQLRAHHDAGVTYRELGEAIGISAGAVHTIVKHQHT